MLPQLPDASELIEHAASNPGLAFTVVLCGLPALFGCYYLSRQHDSGRTAGFEWLEKSSRIKEGPLHQTRAWGHRIAIIVRPMLLVRMESESKAVNTFHPRREKICALTGIQDAARLTEVMEERMIPITIKALAPSGLVSGLGTTAFDRGLEPVFADFCARIRGSGSGVESLRLSEFVSRAVFCATARSFFGPTFPHEDAYCDYSMLASNIQLLHSPISKWPLIARSAHDARGRMMGSFTKYVEEWWYADGYDVIEGISSPMDRILRASKEEELTLEEAAGCLLAMFWDSVVNVTSASFWLMAHALAADSTHRALADEARSRQTHYSTASLLDSAVQETLRWTPLSQPVRHADADATFVIDGKQHALRSGTQIISDMSVYHFDKDLYPDPATFDPQRFLDGSLPLPRAFGEGKHMCKGLHLAQLQIKSFVSNCFKTFDFNMIKDERTLLRRPATPCDIWSPSNDLMIQVRCVP